MPFRAWITVVALVAVTTYAAVGLLEAKSVPVASVVELSGTAPQPRQPSDGFFIVPPQVVDFSDVDDLSRGRDDDSPDDDDVSRAADDTIDDGPDDSPDDDDVSSAGDDGGLDDSPDHSPDDD